jgi:hypothetical protein
MTFETEPVPDDTTSYSAVKPGMAGLAGHKHNAQHKSEERTCPNKLLTACQEAHSLPLQSSI